MTTDNQLAEKLTADHESYLQSTGDVLVEAILEGVKEGAAESLKKGARDALKECLTRGFTNIEAPAIKDILEDIPQEMVKSSVKEGAKRIFKKSTEGYIKKACQKLIKKMQREGIKLSQKKTDYILKIFKISEREALKKIVAKVPQNPLFGAIIAGMQAALEESLEKNFAAYAQKNPERATLKAEKRRAKMATNDELKESVKSLVKKIVGKIVYKLVKASAKKTVAELRKKLKEETIHKIEEKLKEAAENKLEKQLTKSIQKLQKEIAQDNPQGSDYVSQMQQSFEKDCHNFLSSLKGISALKVAVISCACALLIGAGVYFWPPPPPPPDLVITWSEPEWISGEDIVISYTIANLSEAEAGGCCTCVYIGGSFLIEDYIAPLGPGEERMLSCTARLLPEEYGLAELYIAMELCVDGYGDIEESNEENNCITTELTPPPKPDLVITRSEPEWISEEDIVISYTIANQGEAEAGESYTWMFIGGSFFTEDYVAPLGPGEERMLSCTARLLPEEYGLAELYIAMELCADGRGNVEESNEGNNCVTIELTPPPPPPPPDLVITEISYSIVIIPAEDLPSEEEPEEGPIYQFAPTDPVVTEPDYSTYYFTFHYVIENQGEGEAGGSYTWMYMYIFEGPYLSESPYMLDEVAPLGPGEKREVTFSIYYYPLTDEFAFFVMSVCADGEEGVDESNEENNCVKIEDTVY